MIATIAITFFLLLLAIASMAIGVIFKKAKGELKGSCGGPDNNPDCCMIKEKDCDKNLPLKKGGFHL